MQEPLSTTSTQITYASTFALLIIGSCLCACSMTCMAFMLHLELNAVNIHILKEHFSVGMLCIYCGLGNALTMEFLETI